MLFHGSTPSATKAVRLPIRSGLSHVARKISWTQPRVSKDVRPSSLMGEVSNPLMEGSAYHVDLMVLVSVVLPVFNAESLVREAVDSVLGQTLTDLELVVVDDGSTDGTAAILAGYGDRRLRVLRFESNRGYIEALNVGVTEAASDCIGRLDADDFAAPNRLQLQMDLMQSDSRIGLIGSGWEWLDATATPSRGVSTPSTSHAALRLGLHFGNQMVHSSVMFRRQSWVAAGGYLQHQWPAEDYGLWLRISKISQIRAIPDVLVSVRSVEGGVSRCHTERQRALAARIASDALSELLGDRIPPQALIPILTFRFSSCSDFASSERLVLDAMRAVVGECKSRGIDTRGLAAAAARLLHGMRYRTADGKRCTRLLATLPLREPKVAAQLIGVRGRWLLRGRT
jgi:hypothetical protein